MKKQMLISLVIEGEAEDLHEIKGMIIAKASEALVSVKADVIEEPKLTVDAPMFMYVDTDKARRDEVKQALNSLHGRKKPTIEDIERILNNPNIPQNVKTALTSSIYGMLADGKATV